MTSTPIVPLDNYLAVLNGATVTNNPYADMHDRAAAADLSAAFVKLAHGLVAFVNAGRVHLGYTDTIQALGRMLAVFPQPDPAEDIISQVLALLEIGDMDGIEELLGEPCGECDACLDAEAAAADDNDEEQ
jgi:hypothetical protein